MLKPLALFAPIAACLALGACTVHSEPKPVYGYATVTAAPVAYDIYSYPHTFYEGRPTYWYRNHWYYWDNGNWLYYRQEPPALHEYRQRGYVQEAPPAPRTPATPQLAPEPAPQPSAPQQPSPPPAVRVR